MGKLKLRKILFSRLFIVGMAIVFQLAAFLVLLLYLNEYHYIFNSVMHIISFVVLISIINRNMITEAKIPWIIITLILPLFGCALYLSFSQGKMSGKEKKVYKHITDNTKRYFENEAGKHTEVLSRAGKYEGQCRYIENSTSQLSYSNTGTEFYPTGEAFWQALLAELEKAEKYIFMEYFIVQEGVMWDSVLDILKRKLAAGVEVRFMYDDLGSVSTVKWNFNKKLNNMGIKCVKFHPFIPVVSERHNNRDHRKITVIDGRCAFIGGANIADEYINHVDKVGGYWKDSAIKVTCAAVKSISCKFLQNYDIQRGITEDYTPYLGGDFSLEGDGSIVVPYGDGPKPAYMENVSESVLLNMINQAQRYVWITTPYLIIDGKLTEALCCAALRGVDVRIVTPHIPDKKIIFAMTHSYYPRLISHGVKIMEYVPGFVHSKQIVCDDEIAMVGTVNMDYRSLIHHYECGVILIGSECIKDIKADFENMFAKCMDMRDFRQSPIVSMMCRICSVFTPML